MKYTRRTLIRLHRKLWDWCGETGKDKEDWPRWKSNGGDIKNQDFLCFACKSYDLELSGCNDHCLFIWADYSCSSECSEYYNWQRAITIQERKSLAKKIANLKVRRRR